MKKLLIALFAIALVGCGKIDRATAAWTGHASICIEGVSYIQFTSGATVQYNRDGKIKTC